jgi:hypothetical protein
MLARTGDRGTHHRKSEPRGATAAGNRRSRVAGGSFTTSRRCPAIQAGVTARSRTRSNDAALRPSPGAPVISVEPGCGGDFRQLGPRLGTTPERHRWCCAAPALWRLCWRTDSLPFSEVIRPSALVSNLSWFPQQRLSQTDSFCANTRLAPFARSRSLRRIKPRCLVE